MSAVDLWESTVVAGGSEGLYTSLAVLPSGHPAISYYDESYGDLKYTWFDGSEWHDTTVDSEGDVGSYTSLAILPSGHPAISYFDLTNLDLKYAWFDGDVWHATAVDSEGNGGSYTCLAILPPVQSEAEARLEPGHRNGCAICGESSVLCREGVPDRVGEEPIGEFAGVVVVGVHHEGRGTHVLWTRGRRLSTLGFAPQLRKHETTSPDRLPFPQERCIQRRSSK